MSSGESDRTLLELGLLGTESMPTVLPEQCVRKRPTVKPAVQLGLRIKLSMYKEPKGEQTCEENIYTRTSQTYKNNK